MGFTAGEAMAAGHVPKRPLHFCFSFEACSVHCSRVVEPATNGFRFPIEVSNPAGACSYTLPQFGCFGSQPDVQTGVTVRQTRKPVNRLRVSGASDERYPFDQEEVELANEPPRITRAIPNAGP